MKTVLRSPFSVLRSPFSVLRSPFSVLRSPFSVLRSPFSVLRSPFSVLRSPFSVLLSPFSVLRSPFSVLRSPFSVRRFAIPYSLLLARQRRQNPRPAADTFVKARQIELLIGRMHAIVIEREADHQRIHAEHGLEIADDRNRTAGADGHRFLAPLIGERGARLG